MIVVDVENAEILLILEAVGDSCSARLRNAVIVEEEHVQAHVSSQSSANFGNHWIVNLILAQVNSLKVGLEGE